MIAETYLLYTIPLLARFALATEIRWTNVFISQMSILVVFPSTFLPRVISDARLEHVFRHAMYATSFTIAVLTTVHLDRLEGPFLTFCIMGLITLWWFVLSHWLENALDARINTHQGDIAVLPLTLVAIGTFVLTVPDDVFRFSRATIFFVPVIVAWATMFFIAFQDFALHCVTTHEHPSFMYYAYASLVVAISHLTLIETNVSSHTYQVFPLVAAVFCQCIPGFLHRPMMRPRRHISTLACVLTLSFALYYGAVQFRLGHVEVFVIGNVCASLVLPPVNGDRWVLPGTMLTTLVTWALYDSTRWQDLVALAACHYIVLFVTHRVVRPALRRVDNRVLTGSTLMYDSVTRTGRVASYRLPLRVQVLDEERRCARIATWRVPGLRLWYMEHEVTFQTREEDSGTVRATIT